MCFFYNQLIHLFAFLIIHLIAHYGLPQGIQKVVVG